MSTTTLEQQRSVTPEQSASTEIDPHNAPELEALRQRIVQLDDTLIDLLGERARLARQAGEIKRGNGQSTLDPAREAAIVRHAGERARQVGLDDEAVRAIFWQIIGLCRRAQREETAVTAPG